MRNKLLYILLLITSCDTDEAPSIDANSKKNSPVQNEEFSYDTNIFFVKDSLNSNDSLKVYDSQNLTAWGGLTLKYLNDKLQTIETIENAELGFIKKTFSIDDGKIIKVLYVGHLAEWGKFQKKYPEKDFDWDPSKMTYFDTSFTINYTSDTLDESNISVELNQNGIQIIKFINEKNINTANMR